jgi:BlaI family penicillinase repressor
MMKLGGNLSKREHQIMDLAYERGTIVATDLEEALSGNLSNSAVRSYLRSLEAKGYLKHEEEGVRFVYRPAKERDDVARGEASRLVKTFYGGSVSGVLATLLNDKDLKLSDADLAEMRRMIDDARRS